MLKLVPSIFTPDALHALASMGHGDDVAIVDANFPAARVAARLGARLVHLSGVDAPSVLRAVPTLLPVDDFEPAAARFTQVVGEPQAVPPPVQAFQSVLEQAGVPAAMGLERHAFYEAASHAYLILLTGEVRPYGNVLLRKGVVGEVRA